MGTHYTGTAAEKQVLDTWIKLVRATSSVSRSIRDPMEAAGLTESQFGVLEILLHLGPQRQKVLAQKHLVSGGNITMVVNNLERAGLVTRKKDLADGRAHRVELTAHGKALIEEVFKQHLKALMASFTALDRGEQESLGALCKKLGKTCSKTDNER